MRVPTGSSLRQGPAPGPRWASGSAPGRAVRPAGVSPATGPSRPDPPSRRAGGVPGLWRRGVGGPRGDAIPGRPLGGATPRATLRHRGRSLFAVSAPCSRSPPTANLRCAGGGERAARTGRGRAGRADAHAVGRAAGEGRASAADAIRNHGHAGGPRPRAAPHRSSSRADLLGVVPAGTEQPRSHPGRDRLTRWCRPPLAVGIRHADNDGLCVYRTRFLGHTFTLRGLA